jgi:hypothetical protein
VAGVHLSLAGQVLTALRDWTRMAFPQSGSYVVPQALDLVEIDRDRDAGTYRETNLWMRHR